MKTLEHYKLQLKLLVSTSLIASRLRKDGWSFQVSKGGRGYCHYGNKLITIPRFALDNKPGPDYGLYYLYHEMSHALVHIKYPRRGMVEPHGPEFMQQLITICPAHCLHYEVGYKPRNAIAAGISRTAAMKAELPDDDTDCSTDLMDF